MARRDAEPEPTAEPTPTEGEEPVRYDMPNFEAVRWDEGDADWEAGGGGGDPDPQIVSLTPSELVAGGAATTVNVNGLAFDTDAQAEADGAALPTARVNMTLLTVDYTPPAAPGSVTFTVRNVGTGMESNGSPMTIIAAAGDA